MVVFNSFGVSSHYGIAHCIYVIRNNIIFRNVYYMLYDYSVD